MEEPSDIVTNIHVRMRDTTAREIRHVISDEQALKTDEDAPQTDMAILQVEHGGDNQNALDFAAHSAESVPDQEIYLGLESTSPVSSTTSLSLPVEETCELCPAKRARKAEDLPNETDDYLDLVRGAASSTSESAGDENSNWFDEHMESLKNLFVEELTAIQQEKNQPFTIDDDCANEDDHLLPPTSAQLEQAGEGDTGCEMEGLDTKPIYDGAPITVGISALLIMIMAIRHSFTGEALVDILCLINLHCLSPNLCFTSLFRLKKYFHNIKNPITFHYFCAGCLEKIDDKTCEICPNMMCQRNVSGVGGMCFCMEIPLLAQLQTLFSNPDFYDLLDYRFKRSVKNGTIGDVYDGELYRQHFECEDGLLRDKHNISFTYNTDGVPLFKSSRFSLWPLYFAINELPCPQRFKKENMILAGLWCGESKPMMLNFLKPFHDALAKLETEGVEAKSPSGETFISKAILLLGTCDMPAKCMVCNSMQFNGFFGCLKCKQPGCNVRSSKGGNVHVYPFDSGNPTGPARTHLQTREDAKKAFETRKAVDGIKGPCWFAALKYHDIIKGSAVDYMHCVLEGVMKLLLKLWFSSGHAKENFSIARRVGEVDKRLADIKPPNNISRCPRSIEAHSKYWKASELRSFLLFYGAIVLHGILPDMWYQHFMLLSEAVFILSMHEITRAQIDLAEDLIEHFCIIFKDLYSERYQTANMHYLLHIPEDVRNLGPLWTHSCFPFENYNGEMLKLFHGTQNVPFQIVSAISIMQCLPKLEHNLPPGSMAEAFYRKMSSPHLCKNEAEIENGTFAMGGVETKPLPIETFVALSEYFGHVPDATSIRAFSRMRKGGNVYHSKAYKRVHCRNSYTVKYLSEGKAIQYGHINYYFQYKKPCLASVACTEKCLCPTYNFAVMTPLKKTASAHLTNDEITGSSACHIIITDKPSQEKAEVVPLASILEKCVYMDVADFPDRSFLAAFPNPYERD